MSRLGDELRARGIVHVNRYVDPAEFEEMCSSLGSISDRTEVTVREGARTHLASPTAVPLHTDFVVDVISWRCDVQDEVDGASLLLETRAVMERLSSSAMELLRRTPVEVRARHGSAPVQVDVLHRRADVERLCFAPWLIPATDAAQKIGAYDELRESVAAAARDAVSVRLAPGEVLFIENGRLLHGRGAIPPRSQRRLTRRWMFWR
jgi:hypothetical protein